jgi:hypothetical protein
MKKVQGQWSIGKNKKKKIFGKKYLMLNMNGY